MRQNRSDLLRKPDCMQKCDFQSSVPRGSEARRLYRARSALRPRVRVRREPVVGQDDEQQRRDDAEDLAEAHARGKEATCSRLRTEFTHPKFSRLLYLLKIVFLF